MLGHHRRIARKRSGEISGKRARIHIVSAARAVANVEIEILAFIEVSGSLRRPWNRRRACNHRGCEQARQFCETHPRFLARSATLRELAVGAISFIMPRSGIA